MTPRDHSDEPDLAELMTALDHLDTPHVVKCESCGFRVLKGGSIDSCAECGTSLR